jgi:hypothetical protein
VKTTTKTTQQGRNRDATFRRIIELGETRAQIFESLNINDLKNLRSSASWARHVINLTDNKWYQRDCDERLAWPPRRPLRQPCEALGCHCRQHDLAMCRGPVAGFDEKGHGYGFSICHYCRIECANRFQDDRNRQYNFARALCNTCIAAIGILNGNIKQCDCGEDVAPAADNYCFDCRRTATLNFDQEFQKVCNVIDRTRKVAGSDQIEWNPTLDRNHWPLRCPCGDVVQFHFTGYRVCLFCFRLRCKDMTAGLTIGGTSIPDITEPGPEAAQAKITCNTRSKTARQARANTTPVSPVGTSRSPRNHAGTRPAAGTAAPPAASAPPPPPTPAAPLAWTPRQAGNLTNFYQRYRPMVDFLRMRAPAGTLGPHANY